MPENPSYASGSGTESRNRASVARGLWLIPFILAAFAVLVAAYAYYRHETERIRQEKYQELAAIAKLKAGQIRQWRQGQLEDVEAVARGPLFKKSVNEWVRNRINGLVPKDLRNRLLTIQQARGYVDAILLDLNGHVLLSATLRPEPMNADEEKAVQYAIANHSSVLTDLHRTQHDAILMTAVAPLSDPEGQPIAVVVLRSNPESALYPAIESWPTPSRSAETVLIRKDGDEVLFLNDLRHRPGSALSLRNSLAREDFPAAQAVLGHEGLFQGKDYRGVEVLADLRPIPYSPWFMVTKVDASEILAEARYRGAVIAIFATLFILIAGGATAYGYRYRQARLYQELYRSERDQREAQEQFRTTLYSIGDAVITTDIEGLVKQMNPVAETLTGWPEKEAIGRQLEEIFRIINEQTRRPCQNPVEKVIEHGQVVGLANHTVLIGRDGTERVLADSGAPIRDDKGNILGVVLVFRDVTEQARAAEELRNRQETLGAILAASPVGIVLTRDRRIEWANESWVRMFGFDSERQYLDQPTGIMHPAPEAYEKVRKLLYDNIRPGRISEAVATLKRKDGMLFDARIRISLLDASDHSKGTISVISDESEKRKAEESLRASEERYRAVFDNAGIGIDLLDAEGRIVKVNRALLNMLGYSEEELTRRTFLDVTHPEDREISKRNLEALTAREIDSYRLEKRYVKKDGSVVWGDLWTSPIRDETGQHAGTVGVIADITERKNAEKALRESEARYRMLVDNVNDAIFVAQDGFIKSPNYRLAQMTEYGVGELLEQPFTTFIHPEDADMVFSRHRQRTRGVSEPASEYQFRLLRKDGNSLWVELGVTLIDWEGRPATLNVLRDVTERKLAEEELRKSEERYRHIVDNLYDVYYQTDAEGYVSFVSPSIERVFGYRPEEVLGTRLSELYATSSYRERFLKLIIDNGFVDQFEAEMKTSDGRVIWVSTNARLLRDEAGNIRGVEGITRDVTEMKRAVESLRSSEALLNNIIDQSPFSMWISNSSGIMIRMNEACRRTLRITDEDVVGKYNVLADNVVRDQGFMPLVQAVFKRGTAARFELKYDTSKLEGLSLEETVSLILDVTIFPVVDESGAVTNAVIQHIDVTERKHAEEALQESERRFRALVEDVSSVPVQGYDENRKVVFWNSASERLYGYSRDEALGRQIEDLIVQPHMRAEAIKEVNNWITQGEGIPARESERMHKDGHIVPVYSSHVMLESSRGQKEMYSVDVDLAELKRAEKERATLREQLLQAQKMEAIGTLAGGIAHDFNNLLTVVMGFAELLLGEKDQDHPDVADLHKILHAAKNGAELVQRLLMFSRKSEPKPIPMNLNRQIVRVEKLLRRTIPRMIDIRLDLASDLPEINADPSQIEQVLINLAVNARDAMPDAGKLTVRTDIDNLDEEYCRLHVDVKPGEYVVLEMSDTGHGMDKETLEHVFEPFFTTKEMGRGTGLGLAMVYGIVTQHNGHINVYSEVEKGTTFRVYLPAIPAHVEPEAKDSAIMPTFGTETVLLVDDEESVRELGARLLTKYGYTVLQAKSGKDALDIFKSERSHISLVVLDLIMPEMGGRECLQEMLKIDPDVRVLVASGQSAQTSVRESIESGAKGFISKPFRLREMLREVRKVMDE